MKRILIILTILLILLIPSVAYADVGPKSSIEIFVKNAPGEEYYLDLLVKEPERMDAEYIPSGHNEDMYNLLWNYEEDGYRAVITHQNHPGVYGTLKGKYDDNYPTHKLIQVPSVFKIIIVTSDGSIHISDVYHRIKFSDIIYINYETMEISTVNGSVLLDWLLQFLKTYASTILIEGLILLFFGFSLKKNWKPFLLVNLCTQVLLIVSMGLMLVFGGFMHYLLWFALIEAIIIVTESLLYNRLLWRAKPKGRVAYAVTANMVSMLSTFLIILFW